MLKLFTVYHGDLLLPHFPVRHACHTMSQNHKLFVCPFVWRFVCLSHFLRHYFPTKPCLDAPLIDSTIVLITSSVWELPARLWWKMRWACWAFPWVFSEKIRVTSAVLRGVLSQKGRTGVTQLVPPFNKTVNCFHLARSSMELSCCKCWRYSTN